MNAETYAAALAYARAAVPREAVGLVIVQKGRERFFPCRNIAPLAEPGQPEFFKIHPADWCLAEDAGEIVEVVHSHPNGPALPSDADRRFCEESGLPWAVIGLPSGQVYRWEPNGWKAPLVGRQFLYGVFDCYGLARDYYRETHGIELLDFERSDGWEKRGEDLFRKNFAAAGFVEVPKAEMRPGDGLLMHLRPELLVPHHCGVFLEGGQFLHHVRGRLSSRETYGGLYLQATTHVLRHEALR